MPYSDQVKETAESMGKEGEKNGEGKVTLGALARKLAGFTSCHRAGAPQKSAE